MNERRQHCRVSGEMVRHVAIRVRGGCDGTLLNFCRLGAAIAVPRPISPGSWLDLHLAHGAARAFVRALVLRCSVRGIAPLDGVTYEAALQFQHETDLPREQTAHGGYSMHAESGTKSITGGSDIPAALSDPSAPWPEPSK
jgi:hypothetical protein